ncbi:hypothetical protein B0H19DRAFT_1060448 [Mycena capillaripes]|nr:hypothetical protein B0H19DRAFT_1060448 [Mycena capillaripes]
MAIAIHTIISKRRLRLRRGLVGNLKLNDLEWVPGRVKAEQEARERFLVVGLILRVRVSLGTGVGRVEARKNRNKKHENDDEDDDCSETLDNISKKEDDVIVIITRPARVRDRADNRVFDDGESSDPECVRLNSGNRFTLDCNREAEAGMDAEITDSERRTYVDCSEKRKEDKERLD